MSWTSLIVSSRSCVRGGKTFSEGQANASAEAFSEGQANASAESEANLHDVLGVGHYHPNPCALQGGGGGLQGLHDLLVQLAVPDGVELRVHDADSVPQLVQPLLHAPPLHHLGARPHRVFLAQLLHSLARADSTSAASAQSRPGLTTWRASRLSMLLLQCSSPSCAPCTSSSGTSPPSSGAPGCTPPPAPPAGSSSPVSDSVCAAHILAAPGGVLLGWDCARRILVVPCSVSRKFLITGCALQRVAWLRLCLAVCRLVEVVPYSVTLG